MKNLKLILALFLFSQLNFAQQTYTITEGELQFINCKKGIVIKKDDLFYALEIKVVFQNKKQKIETNLTLISDENLKNYSQKNKSVSYEEIDEDFNFEQLKKISLKYIDRFRPEDKDYDEYKLCLVNNNFFALFTDRYQNRKVVTKIEDYMPYIFIQFDNKKIIFTYENDELLIIPTKKNIKIFSFDNYIPNYKAEKLKIKNLEIYEFTQHTIHDLEDHFFVIDTLPSKKVQLKNIYNEILISQPYDSIAVKPIIHCYNNNKEDLYNLTFKKINTHPLQASVVHLGSIQILDRNKLKWIDWTGKEVKKPTFFMSYSFPEAFVELEPRELTINKKGNTFYLVDTFFNDQTKIFQKDSISLINTSDIDALNLIENSSFNKIIKHNMKSNSDELKYPKGLIYFRYDVVLYRMKNGRYGFNFIEKFVNPNFKNNEFDIVQDLQSIKNVLTFYKLEKNNLFMLYPLQKTFRYKLLGEFQYNYARFKLPNGKKGWLKKDGKEYLDQ